MKLLRFSLVGEERLGMERPGILDAEGRIRDLSGEVSDISFQNLSEENLKRIGEIDLSALPIVDDSVRIVACVGGVGKFICVGLNYRDHAAETGAKLPSEPIIFSKATSAICGANDNIELPRGSNKTDWEVELGLVIGKRAKYVNEAEAIEHIAGFCLVNDLSERDFQKNRNGQWVKGKSCDSFGPIGPWLVTREEIEDPQNLAMYLEVNGHRYQNGSTRDMIFGVRQLVSYISQFMSLLPGDIISTGTPSGVGLGQKPPVYLKVGDRVKAGIEGLGVQQKIVVSAK